MRLAERVRKLERTELLKRHLPPLEQLQRALDESAVRLTGRGFSFAQDDEPTLDQIMADLRDSFLHKLGSAELAGLMAELEPIAFGGDTEALEAARREAIMGMAEEAACVRGVAVNG